MSVRAKPRTNLVYKEVSTALNLTMLDSITN